MRSELPHCVLRRRQAHVQHPGKILGVNPATIRASLLDAALPRLEIHMLWQSVLGCSRAWLAAHDTDPLDSATVAQFQRLRARRLQGEPMAYILGRREFMGHEFLVSPAVLIPRPETEHLVQAALDACARIRQRKRCQALRVLDLGTGSGAIAISLALFDASLHVTATDLSAAALEVARQNAHRLQASVAWRQGEWYDALSRQDRYDLIVSNPPYIASGDAHLQQGDLRFEPQQALTDNADGLHDLCTIVAGAPRHLTAGGELWVEHGWDQAARVRERLAAAGFDAVESLCDLAGIERLSGGALRRPL